MNKKIILEGFNNNSLIPLSYEGMEKIMFQIKNCVCKIHKKNGDKGSGFFCKINNPSKSNFFYFLITCQHVLDENDLKENNIIKYTVQDDTKVKEIIIDEQRKIFFSSKYDISFIEIRPNADNIKNYLEIDYDLIGKDINFIETTYTKKSVYVIHSPRNNNDFLVSYGLLSNISKENISHLCYTKKGSSGSPIISLETFKVIGIHRGTTNSKEKENDYNLGIFIKYPLNEYEMKNNKSKKVLKEDTLSQTNKKDKIELPLINKNENIVGKDESTHLSKSQNLWNSNLPKIKNKIILKKNGNIEKKMRRKKKKKKKKKKIMKYKKRRVKRID